MYKSIKDFVMNPYYMQMMQQAGQQQHGMPLQNIPQQPVIRPTVIPYNVETAEQMSAIIPMPNTIYLGINDKDRKIFIKRMNNDGLTDVQTYILAGEQTKKTDTQEILARLANLESKLLSMGVKNESTNVA